MGRVAVKQVKETTQMLGMECRNTTQAGDPHSGFCVSKGRLAIPVISVVDECDTVREGVLEGVCGCETAAGLQRKARDGLQ